ncbi:restriction endonuclease subunit S [Bradyrhizobium sp. AUGA SZCCT0158]|uniref:restriction endonuclease subunit S n=1 Tax=Bradyrhizobium sp. AUGA SZCCT0158 TaxID=2807661 RepID=UPI001BA6D7F1|nr:restriction endonuclease subunit S [Bradyrhizobium sp. AUGA SZCCT0158]MBR1199325.1 restriction endonuclease subunit S [Bradyrhizobium sp. AUGA SZCCT0158]
MSIRRYDSYRESGVEWIRTVPTHWEVKPLLAVAAECNRPNRGMIENNLLSLSYGRVVRKDINENDGLLPESFETYQIVEPNDIVWRLTDLQNDKRSLRTALVGETGIITSAYLATAPTGIDPRYLSYLLRAYDLQKVFYSMGGGLRQGMRFSDVKRLPILLPSEREQVAISDFLDRETAKIDALVEEQQRLIGLLEEKREIVNSHGVTKGLNPAALMKNAGAEWLGDVPAHWRVVALKRLIPRGVSISYGIVQPGEAQDEGVPFVQTSNMSDEDFAIANLQKTTPEIAAMYPRSCLAGGEVILGIRASIGACHVVPDLLKGCNLSRGVARIECDSSMLSEYLVLYLRSANVARYWGLARQGTTFNEVSIETVRNALVTVPPKDEQEQIVSVVTAQLRQFTSILNEAKRTIELLMERRAALVSAAVTGKIQVCGVFAPASPKLDRKRLRLIVGATIIEALAGKPNSGRVKSHKIVYLTQAHAGVHELEGAYLRQAAGPLDVNLLDEIEAEVQNAGHVSIEQPKGSGSQVTYKICGKRGHFRGELDAALGCRADILDKLIADLGDLDTRHVEAVATLYAVWNDALLDGEIPSDDIIVSGFLNEWHPEKRERFVAGELHTWLDWMRRHGLVPQGRGSRTTTGRLFA